MPQSKLLVQKLPKIEKNRYKGPTLRVNISKNKQVNGLTFVASSTTFNTVLN